MLFYGLYNMDNQFPPQIGPFSNWVRPSAFVKPPSKNGKRYRSFMIEDILNDKQEADSLMTSSSSSMVAAFQPPHEEFLAVPSSTLPVFPINFYHTMLQRPAPRPCNPASTAQRQDTENVPKYFRTSLKESHKNRRNRTVFSRLQMQKMEEHFERKKYLSSQDRNDFAKSLCLTSLQVKTWYQNRRMKWKKEMLSIDPTAVTTRAKGRPRKGEF